MGFNPQQIDPTTRPFFGFPGGREAWEAYKLGTAPAPTGLSAEQLQNYKQMDPSTGLPAIISPITTDPLPERDPLAPSPIPMVQPEPVRTYDPNFNFQRTLWG